MAFVALVVLSALAGVLTVSVDSPEDYTLSSALCNYITSNKSSCRTTLQSITSQFCSISESFFTDIEIGKFIDSTKIDIEALDQTTQSYIETTQKVLSYVGKIPGIGSIVRAVGDIIKMYFEFDRDFDKAAYAISNVFNLGAVCLAANPSSYSSDGAPVVKPNVQEEMSKLCVSAADMLKDYAVDLVNTVCGAFSISCGAVTDQVERAFNLLKDQKLCDAIVTDGVHFGGGDVSRRAVGEFINDVFGPVNLILNYLENIIENLGSNIKKCVSNLFGGSVSSCIEDIFSFDDLFLAKELEESYNRTLQMIEERPKKNMTAEIIVSSSGFDVYKASKSNPEYKPMVDDALPDKMKSGIPDWLLYVLIGVGAVAVLGGIIGGIVCCVQSSKKKSNQAQYISAQTPLVPGQAPLVANQAPLVTNQGYYSNGVIGYGN